MTSKRHHAVPQFVLRRFADANGLLWLHDLQRLIAVQVQPRDALVETHLYAPGVGENPTDDALERFLADHVEGPAATPLDKLAMGDSLTDEDRYRVALLIAFQEIRIPRMRETVGGFVGEIGERIMRVAADHPEYMRRVFKEMGKEVAEADLEKMIEGIKGGGIKVEATKVAWLQSTSNAHEIAKMLYRMPWMVAEAPPGFEFFTSDAPIAKVLTNPAVPRRYAGGWISPSAESTFALDTTRCLVIRPDGKEGRVTGPKEWCEDVNSRLVGQARRFVVSRVRAPEVEIFARQRTGSGDV